MKYRYFWAMLFCFALLLSGCGAKEDTFSLSAAESGKRTEHITILRSTERSRATSSRASRAQCGRRVPPGS